MDRTQVLRAKRRRVAIRLRLLSPVGRRRFCFGDGCTSGVEVHSVDFLTCDTFIVRKRS
jgi:hypothetical protein